MRAFAALLVLQAAAAQRTDFEKITCPVVGTFVKNGLLVPDADGLITKEQTLAAFLDHGVPERIAVETTDGNFFSDACPVCPPTIDPFEMNVIGMADVSSPPNGPQEHFRSTGVREGNGLGAFLFGEAICLGGKDAWTREDVECFTDVWDREQGCSGVAFSNDVDESKRPAGCGLCQSKKQNPACRSALFDTIMFMFDAFKDNETGTFEKEKYRAMWVDLELPTPLPLVLFEDTFTGETLAPEWWVSAWQSGVRNGHLRLRDDHFARVKVPLPLNPRQTQVHVAYDMQTVDVAPGVGLTVQGRFDSGPWFVVSHHEQHDGSFAPFEHTFGLFAGARELKVRFVLNGSSLAEKVRIDNVAITLVA